MGNKKVKRILGCICALTLLAGSVSTDAVVVSAEESATETEYYDVLDDNALQLHGVTYDETEKLFKRMDLTTAASIAGIADEVENKTYKFVAESEDEDTGKVSYSFKNNVYSHAREAAGGRIRFSTDSSYVSIKATLQNWYYAYAKSMKDGKYGFDVYVDTEEGSTYAGTISVTEYPTTDGRDAEADGRVQVEGTVEFDTAETRNLTIYFPITIETKSVEVGVAAGSTIAAHTIPYEADQKIVFYGSSITQGGAVTKPGNTYVNTVGRNLNMEYLSLGMWGSAKGQIAFAEYIAAIEEMTAFVFDYDHNNKNVTDLDGSKVPDTDPVEWTNGEYWAFYETIREAYQNLPIIMVTRPNNYLDIQNASAPNSYSTATEMKAFIRAAYEKAKAAGDENVHFVDGEAFFDYSTGYLADNVHPNDAGQARMAEVMTAVLEKAFAGEKNLCVEPANCQKLLLNEDFENGADNWKVTKSNTAADAFEIVTQENGNKAYQLQYTRSTTVGTPSGYLRYKSKILDGVSDYAIEQDVTIYKNENGKWSYLGVVPTNSDSGSRCRYDVRIMPTSSGCRVELIDVSDADSDNQGEYDETIVDEELAAMYTGTEFSYHLKTEVRNVINGDGSKSVVFAVSVDDHTVTFNIQPRDQAFAANELRLYLYSYKVNDVFKAVIDDVKVYRIAHILDPMEEVPATVDKAGTKAHYVCSTCGEKFLDAKGIIKVTDADLVTNKCCSVFSEDFTLESGEDINDSWISSIKNTLEGGDAFGVITQEDGNSVYQMAYTRSTSVVGTPSGYIRSTDAMLKGISDYTIEMDMSLYKGETTENVARWSSLGLVLRDSSTQGYYDIRFDVKKTGCQVQLFDETSDTRVTYDEQVVEDSDLVAMYNAGGPFSFHVRVVADNYVDNNGSEKIKLSIYVDENAAVVYDITPSAECSPTSMRLFLYGGVKTADIKHKALVDNIQVYTQKHSLSHVEKVASTDDIAGTKAHYECDACGKKFLNSTATEEVTDAELTYAKLTDIKCQTRVNENGLTDIRFVAFVDDYTQYQSVTFKITLTSSGKSGTALCKDVYTAVYAGGTRYKTDDIYSVEGYFAAFKLTNNTEADLAEEMTVLVTWTDLEGNTRTSERTITISEAQ